MTIAILALQGAFIEHEQVLHRLGHETLEIRNLADWQRYCSEVPETDRRLVIPGGESTAMTRIIRDEALYEPIREAILHGMPVLGTCAGLIMLDANHLATMDIRVRRNAYGRQLGSFTANTTVAGIASANEKPFPMVFIRAPYIESVGDGVEVLATVDNHIVAARQDRQLAVAFHPELTDDTRLHELFVSL